MGRQLQGVLRVRPKDFKQICDGNFRHILSFRRSGRCGCSPPKGTSIWKHGQNVAVKTNGLEPSAQTAPARERLLGFYRTSIRIYYVIVKLCASVGAVAKRTQGGKAPPKKRRLRMITANVIFPNNPRDEQARPGTAFCPRRARACVPNHPETLKIYRNALQGNAFFENAYAL